MSLFDNDRVFITYKPFSAHMIKNHVYFGHHFLYIWYFFHIHVIYLLSHHLYSNFKSNLFNLCKFHNNDDSISLLCDICNFSWGLFKLGLLAKIHNKIFQGTFQLEWCLTSQSITSTGGYCSLSKLPSPGWNLHFIC
jgi:hypothetical protein